MMVQGLLLLLLHADLLTTSAGSSRSRRQNGKMKGSDYYMETVKDEISEGTWTTWTKDNGMMKAAWTENDNGMMKATWTEKDGMMEVNIFLSKIFIAFLLLFFLLMSLN